jgi:hypothetical protein
MTHSIQNVHENSLMTKPAILYRESHSILIKTYNNRLVLLLKRITIFVLSSYSYMNSYSNKRLE